MGNRLALWTVRLPCDEHVQELTLGSMGVARRERGTFPAANEQRARIPIGILASENAALLNWCYDARL